MLMTNVHMAYKVAVLIIMSYTLTGCGKPELRLAPGTEVYVARFVSYAEEQGTPVELNKLTVTIDTGGFTERANELGKCEYDNPRHISILKSYWEEADDLAKEVLMFHELGHCVLNRQHTTSRSVMTAEVPSDLDYGASHAFYVHELFHP